MPKRLKNQHTAKKRREEKRELLKRPGISRGRAGNGQVLTQPVSATATAATKPQTITTPTQTKTYEFVLMKGPDNEYQQDLWIESIRKVFDKTEEEARSLVYYADWAFGG